MFTPDCLPDCCRNDVKQVIIAKDTDNENIDVKLSVRQRERVGVGRSSGDALQSHLEWVIPAKNYMQVSGIVLNMKSGP